MVSLWCMLTYISISKEEVRMETTTVRRTSREAVASPDPSWRDLYRAGGFSAILYIVLLIIPIVLIFTTPQPPISGGAATLEYIASNKLVYITELVLFLAPSVVAMIFFLALYMALKHVNKSLAAIGTLIAIASQIIGLAYNSSPQSLNGALVLLSDQFRPFISFGYIVFFTLEVIWLITVGWKLFRLGENVEV